MRNKLVQLPGAVQTGPSRAAIYARVSTEKQRGREDDDKLSLQDQEAGCRKLCQAKGYVVNEQYVVREVSSGDNVHRPLLEEIYGAAKRGEIDLLVMYKVNRFARNDEKAMYLYGRAVYEHNIRIEFVEAPPNDRLERFYLRFKSMFAEEYRDEVAKQTLEKRRERVTKRGLLLPGAWPLFGYVWDDPVKKRRYLIDEEAAAIVRRIFALSASGLSLVKITRLLNAEGVPTPSVYQRAKGRFPESRPVSPVWRQNYITRILKTPAYWGEHAAFRHSHKKVTAQDQATGKYVQYHEIRLRQEGDEEMIFLPPEVCPPLIEKWRAEAAHQRMRANKQEAGKHSRSVKEALLRGGYILCGFCGRPMYCSTHPGKGAPVYHCRSVREQYEGIIPGCQSRTHVAHTVIDDVVWQAIVDYFSDPSWLERILARERDRETSEAENKIKQLAELEETLASKEAAADHLVRLAANITSESMREKLQDQMNELGAELETLKKERAHLLMPPLTQEALHAQRQAFQVWVEAALAGLEHANLEQKRMALYWLGAEVRVWRVSNQLEYEIVLTWRGLNAGRTLFLRERNAIPSLSND